MKRRCMIDRAASRLTRQRSRLTMDAVIPRVQEAIVARDQREQVGSSARVKHERFVAVDLIASLKFLLKSRTSRKPSALLQINRTLAT